MNWVDLILLGVVGLFGLRGFFRGLFREILSLAGLVVGFMMAVKFDEPMAAYATQHWKFSPLVLKGIAFVVIFFFVYFSFNLVGWLLHRSEGMLFLKTFNRAGGVAIGVAKGAALTALVIFFVGSSSLLSRSARDSLNSAYLVSPLSQLAESLIRVGKEKVFTRERPMAPPSGHGAAI